MRPFLPVPLTSFRFILCYLAYILTVAEAKKSSFKTLSIFDSETAYFFGFTDYFF